jgi:hypothetical protein
MSRIRLIVQCAAIAVAASSAPLAARAADLNAEIMNARMHAGLAAQASSLAMVQTHLHHTLNCLVGPNGKGFDAKELNPCASDGSGAISDEADAAKKKALQAAADKASAAMADSDVATAQKDASSVATMLTNVK